jgi:hypothetical protein
MSAPHFRILAPGDHPDYRDLPNDIAAASWYEFMLDDPITKDAGVYVEPNVWMVHLL